MNEIQTKDAKHTQNKMMKINAMNETFQMMWIINASELRLYSQYTMHMNVMFKGEKNRVAIYVAVYSFGTETKRDYGSL